MKRALSLLLVAANLLFVPLGAKAAAYADIAQTRYGPAFWYLNTIGVAKGFSDGTARPYQALNRSEALKMILADFSQYHPRVQWYREHPFPLPLFADVTSSSWYAPLVETGFEAGLVNGYNDGTFKPGNTVRLSEGLALLFRAQKVTVPKTEPWYQGYMQEAYNRNILSPEEQWDPAQYLSRGEFMDIVYRNGVARRGNMVAFVEPSSHAISNTTEPGKPEPSAVTYTQPRRTTYVPPRATYTPPRTATASAPVRTPTTNTSQPLTSPGSSTVHAMTFTISIPSLGISNLLVTHPTNPSTSQGLLAVLKNGVGHLFSFPGTNGKILVYGHSSSYAWDVSSFTKIFRQVNKLRAGDKVYITYAGKEYTYEVTHQEQVSPADTSRYTGPGEQLILYTCWPPDTIDKRLLVFAKPVGTVASR